LTKQALKNENNVYTLFVASDECQRIAVNREENCTACYSNMPPAADTTICLQYESNIQTEGSYIEWYSSETENFPFFVGDSLWYKPNNFGLESLFLVNVANNCSSPQTEIRLLVTNCLPRYTIQGKIIAPNDALPARVYLYENTDSVAFLLDSTITDSDNNYFFQTELGTKIIKAVPQHSEYTSTFFGNTAIGSNAYRLNLITDVVEANIILEQKDAVRTGQWFVSCYSNNNVLACLDYVDITLYSLNGQPLKSCNGCKELDVIDLPSGIYVAKIRNSEIEYSKKIMKGEVR